VLGLPQAACKRALDVVTSVRAARLDNRNCDALARRAPGAFARDYLARQLSTAEVIARGWTRAGIARFLVQPDWIDQYHIPHVGDVTAYYYRLVRVTAAERTPEWQARSRKRQSRAAAAIKAVKTKRDKSMAHLRAALKRGNWTAHWPATGKLKKLALESYNDHNSESGKYADGSEPPEFVARICKNYLRHECTDYDELLREFRGRVGIDEIHLVLQQHVSRLADVIYPHLMLPNNVYMCVLRRC
jgi:hypothetical protein